VRGSAAARSAVQHANLHEVRFVHFLDGVFFFAESGGERTEAHWSATVFIKKCDHQVTVDLVEAVFINTEHVEGFLGDLPRDAASRSNLCEIAGTAQEPVGYARCAPATSSNLLGARVVHLNIQDFRRKGII